MLSLLWLLFSHFGTVQDAPRPAGGADYRYYQSAVRNLPIGPHSPAYAVCDMLETFTGVPAHLDAEALRAREREHGGEGSFATFYQYLLEHRGLLRYDPGMDSSTENNYTHYVCPPGSVLSFAESSKINAPNKIVALLNQGIKGIVVSYDFCPKDWKKGNWKLDASAKRHRPKSMHTVLIVGHQDSSFIFKNSWGNAWGEGGYGRMSFDYHRKHAREGIVTYLAEASAPKTDQIAPIAFKMQPETLDGKDYLQISIVAAGPGSLPVLSGLDYTLSTGGQVFATKKAMLMETSKSNGYPCMLEIPGHDVEFQVIASYSTTRPTQKMTCTLQPLRWENAEYAVPAQ